MSGRMLTDMADVLRRAGVEVVEYGGWTTRARSSGGYSSGRPVCCMWHHTASDTSPANDADYMCYGSSDRPIANLLIPRDGTAWVLAAGCTNTNGKGRSIGFSTATVPADSMNTHAIGIEMANNGVGQSYPQAQIDTMFRVNNALADAYGFARDDLSTHQFYAPDRKIDPATTDAVQGPWRPGSCTSSGTWNRADVQAEARRRGGSGPVPPPPSGEDEFMLSIWGYAGHDTDGAIYAVSSAGFKYWLTDQRMVDSTVAYCAINGWNTEISGTDDRNLFKAFGPVLGPSSGDAWGLP